MRYWPRSLPLQVGVVITLAGAAIVALTFAVEAHDARAEAAAAAAVPPPYEPEPVPPIRLQPVDGTIQLALRAEVAADAAPVVQILAGGGFAVRRALPLPQGPEPTRAVSPLVVLPAALDHLDPAARATAAEVFGALVAERPIPASRFLTLGFELELRALERVLAWVP